MVGGRRTVVRNNGLTRDGIGEERGRAVVGPQKLPENNRKMGKRRGYLKFFFVSCPPRVGVREGEEPLLATGKW